MGINEINLTRILALEGRDFIEAAYEGLLLRDADQEGVENYISLLEHGVSKEGVLFDLRLSEEGIKKDVELTGFNIHEIDMDRILGFEGSTFIEAAYIAVLGRKSDIGGKQTYLNYLYNGEMSKLDVLCALRFSEEGQKLGVDIKGLDSACNKQKVKRILLSIPLIGRTIKFLSDLLHMNHKINAFSKKIDQGLKDEKQRLGDMQCGLDNLKRELNELKYEFDRLNLEKMEQQRINKLTVGNSYKNYEDKMRGSRAEILERLNIYEAIIKKVKVNNGERLFALDLGCGRGEWLELMEKTYHINAIGVDSDESMLDSSQKFGLSVVNADLLAYIKSAESNSVDIITMFQVAEHLPISVLIEVLDECSRVLRKGGAVIIETPNPENLIVGSCNFYLDPTHITKLPPALLKILVESAGMSEAEIVRLHLYDAIDVDKLEQNNLEQATIKQLAAFLNNYADYAVIAFKK